MLRTAILAVLFGLISVSNVFAGDVAIKGVHLCCGACVRDANAALADLEGIDNVGIDRNTKTITFTAANEDALKEAITSLAEGGFHGTATHDKKEVAFPASGAKKDAKSAKIVLNGVHLCCGACVKGAQEAVQDVEGVASIDIDRSAKTVTLSGKEIDVNAAVAALNKGGFHATVAE